MSEDFDGLEDYRAAVEGKRPPTVAAGFAGIDDAELSTVLRPLQRLCAGFALRTGRSACFLDTGLGKTGVELTFADEVVRRTNRPVLMLAPLACGPQHLREAETRFGIDAVISRDGAPPTRPKVAIANYERLDRFDPADWGGVVLDESSILKSFTGATTRKLIAAFASTPYRLAATATPAPNDHTELGQHSEFLGVMPSPEMLSRWFIADQGNGGKYRIKRPAARPFWDWVASWARAVAMPSDLGLSDDGYVLPGLAVERHRVAADRSIDVTPEKSGQGLLFRMPDTSATAIHREKRLTMGARARRVAEILDREPAETWVVWCDTDYDQDALEAEFGARAFSIRGATPADRKVVDHEAWLRGERRILITKPKIFGYGLNWQHCARMAFCGLSFSYELYYQAIRRCWRFGQARPVHVHVVCADTEEAIWSVVERKAGDHGQMKAEMTAAMARASRSAHVLQAYRPQRGVVLPDWLRVA